MIDNPIRLDNPILPLVFYVRCAHMCTILDQPIPVSGKPEEANLRASLNCLAHDIELASIDMTVSNLGADEYVTGSAPLFSQIRQCRCDRFEFAGTVGSADDHFMIRHVVEISTNLTNKLAPITDDGSEWTTLGGGDGIETGT